MNPFDASKMLKLQLSAQRVYVMVIALSFDFYTTVAIISSSDRTDKRENTISQKSPLFFLN
jgi:hypothetical protein